MGPWGKGVQKVRKIFHHRSTSSTSQPDPSSVEQGLQSPVGADLRPRPSSSRVPSSTLKRDRKATETTHRTSRSNTAASSVGTPTIVQLDEHGNQMEMSASPNHNLQRCEFKNVLPDAESGYFVSKEDLKGCLEREFGTQWDFEISNSNYRWKFKTPREVQAGMVSAWVREVQQERKVKRQQDRESQHQTELEIEAVQRGYTARQV